MTGLDNYFDRQLRDHNQRVFGDGVEEHMEEWLRQEGYEQWMINALDDYIADQAERYRRSLDGWEDELPEEWIGRKHENKEIECELNEYILNKHGYKN